MTDEQLISGAQALLDLDARGALVPHGIGGHGLTSIREKVVLAIAFLGRDAGTDRMETTLPQVIDGLVEADAALLKLLAAAPEGWPIKLDMVTSSQFVARVQSDALTTIALPMIEELSKRPQTVWGDIVKALRSKAEELWIPEGKAEPGEAAAIERCAKVADGVRQRLEAGRNGKPLGQIDEHAASIADSIAQKIRALSTPPGAP